MGEVREPQIVVDHRKSVQAREYVGRAADYMLDGNSAAALASVIAAVDRLVDIAQGRP